MILVTMAGMADPNHLGIKTHVIKILVTNKTTSCYFLSTWWEMVSKTRSNMRQGQMWNSRTDNSVYFLTVEREQISAIQKGLSNSREGIREIWAKWQAQSVWPIRSKASVCSLKSWAYVNVMSLCSYRLRATTLVPNCWVQIQVPLRTDKLSVKKS